MDDTGALESLILEMGLDIGLVDTILAREKTDMIEDILFSLDLSNLGIQFIPDIIGEFEFLETLDLSNNELVELNPLLLDLIHLTHINLLNNPIPSLPDRFVPYIDMISIEPYKLPEMTDTNHYTTAIQYEQPKIQRFYVEVDTQREADLIPILLDVYRERRCCKIAGRLEDKFCTLCGRLIPTEFKP